MPSISARFKPASASASSAALLMRSSEEEPSCLPNAVSPTPVMKLMSVGLRQSQHLLCDKTSNELRADRGNARDQGFAQITLDVEFFCVAEAAMGHHGLLARLKPGFARKIFRGIGGRTARQALIVLPARRQRHQPGGLKLHPVLCQRMLDRLVLADRAIEYDAGFGVGGGTSQRELAEPDRFGGDQDAFGIHAVQNIFE